MENRNPSWPATIAAGNPRQRRTGRVGGTTTGGKGSPDLAGVLVVAPVQSEGAAFSGGDVPAAEAVFPPDWAEVEQAESEPAAAGRLAPGAAVAGIGDQDGWVEHPMMTLVSA